MLTPIFSSIPYNSYSKFNFELRKYQTDSYFKDSKNLCQKKKSS